MGKTRVPRDLSDARFGGALDATTDELVVGEAVALDVQPAGIALRLAAALLDGACLVVLLAMLLFGLLRSLPAGTDAVWILPVAIVSGVTVLVLVPAGVEAVTRGKSVGRWAAGTRVVRVDGGAVGFRHAFTRALVGLLELWSTLGSVALVVALFGSRPRRLGDLLAGTFVQHERGARRRDVQVLLPVELVPWAAVADVSALPQRLEDRLGTFFRSVGDLRPEAREATARTLAAAAAEYASPVPDVHPEVFLAGVVAVRRERDVRALRARAALLDGAAAVAGARPPGFPR
ncbi:RDD family protein [Curtobacterium sp. RHCJP20]|uniref:RDD family protein n=1 Tax=Curtobacterium subtropicum TaxID=3055138 RepID=A0ABT7TH03_9MICO|nr:RDD family protein [Curtobacterium subtropicum]MDM7888865.1 RDD family protein [Curtobacterium subtropicum]